MRQTVIGIFNNKTNADEAISQLEINGFSRNKIDISQCDITGNAAGQNEYEENQDSFSRFFNSLFDGSDDADKYSSVARNNECLVTVHTDSSEEAMRAAEVLDNNGAIDIEEQASQYGNSKLERHLSETEGENKSIPVIEEHMEVGKRQVETGRTRIRSKIIERPVEETVRLRQEHIHIERNPVNRPVSESELNNFEETNIEVTERAEVPVVSKEARVVEEVRINKDVDEHDEIIRENVRKTQVDIDKDDIDNPQYRDTDDLDNPNYRKDDQY